MRPLIKEPREPSEVHIMQFDVVLLGLVEDAKISACVVALSSDWTCVI